MLNITIVTILRVLRNYNLTVRKHINKLKKAKS